MSEVALYARAPEWFAGGFMAGVCVLQGYLAHEKLPLPYGPP